MSDHDQRRLTLAMSGRDLMTIGIFAAIYLVLYYGITMFGFLNPVMMIATLGLSVVVGAIPFMLFLARVKHAGMVFLFTLIVALVCLVLGFPPVAVVLLIALSVVIEVIQAVTGYRSRWAGVISYIVFAMWYAGPLLPLYYDRAGYFSSMVANGRDEAYEMLEVVAVPTLRIQIGAHQDNTCTDEEKDCLPKDGDGKTTDEFMCPPLQLQDAYGDIHSHHPLCALVFVC